MKYSFVTCTYNRADNLRRTLISLCDQSHDRSCYEIIIVDNNSIDHTSDVCTELKGKYEDRQIRYFKELNQGLSFALNRGIKEAQGEYLIYVDDDETVDKEHLERLDHFLNKYPDAVLVATQVIPVYESPEPVWMSHFTQRLIGGYFDKGNDVKKLDKKSYPGTGHTIIKKELYQRYGYYNTDLGRTGNGLMGAEDKDMVFRLINNGVACYYFPQLPIYHHIPAYKLSDDFFDKLTFSIGKSERIRTSTISKKLYYHKLFDECIKWIASIILCCYYVIRLQRAKGVRLLRFRKNVSKGLLCK